jgi:Tol biopolymer transport system component
VRGLGLRGGQPLAATTALLLVLLVLALLGGAILGAGRLLQQQPGPRPGQVVGQTATPSARPSDSPAAVTMAPAPARLPEPLPTLPPGRLGHLAYGLGGDVFVADWDGSNPVRITDQDAQGGPAACRGYWGEGAIWSPDGRHLAYRSRWDDACEGRAFITDPEGRAAVSFPSWGWLVSWSPDSTRVATWIAGDPPWETIGIFGVDGTLETQLAAPLGMGTGDWDPSWLQDGGTLIGNTGMALPIGGGPPWPLPLRLDRWSPFSPDGRQIAYESGRSVMVIGPDFTKPRLVATMTTTTTPVPPCGDCAPDGTIENLVWSPAGDRIAVSITHGRYSELYLVDVASGAITPLDTALDVNAVSVRPITFSPEGDRLLYVTSDANWSEASSSLYSVRSDGTDKRLLVVGTMWGDWQYLPPAP